MKKPSIPFVSARDAVFKLCSRKGYFKTSDGQDVHLVVRTPIEHDDYLANVKNSGFVRAYNRCVGNLILPLPSGGSRCIMLVHNDLSGSLPGIALKKIKSNAPG